MIFDKEELDKPAVLELTYLPSLDGLRGVSIIMVLFSHIFFTDKNLVVRIFSGDFGVHIFFVISGFLITTLLLKEKTKSGNISLYKFYIRRSLRIFPVAYLFLLILFFLNIIFSLNITISSFISSALYLRNTSVFNTSDWYTGHFWSLATEEQFYLLFPILLKKYSIQAYFKIVVVLIILIPILNYACVHQFISYPPFLLINQITRNMSGILVGSCFAVFFFNGHFPVNLLSKRNTLYSLVIFFSAAIIQSNFVTFIPSAISATISSSLIAILIILNIHVKPYSIFFKVLNNKYLMYLGILSYSIYVWQQIFTFNMPWENLWAGANSVLLNMTGLLLVSYLSYNFYEKKFLKLKERFH